MLTENILDSSCLESLGEWQQWAGHGIRTSYLGVSVTPVPLSFLPLDTISQRSVGADQ